jgi:pimeloyl-ACP methyl ester carboxylesterase
MPELKDVALPQGVVQYRESGKGEPVVFVHGALVNGLLWRKVTPELDDLRCIVPDLPLGAHSRALREDADLSPPGLARLVNDFLEALDLEEVTLVGNDTGGAICQLVAVNHPDRIARLVLTNCDAYDNFPPVMFRYLKVAAGIPGGLGLLMQSMRIRLLRRAPIAFGWLSNAPVDREVEDAWVRPAMQDRGVRRDIVKVLKGLSPRYTRDAAERLRAFEKPVLLAWAPEDRFFKLRDAERLAAELPRARLELIEGSLAFVPQDQPERLAELIRGFVREGAAA